MRSIVALHGVSSLDGFIAKMDTVFRAWTVLATSTKEGLLTTALRSSSAGGATFCQKTSRACEQAGRGGNRTTAACSQRTPRLQVDWVGTLDTTQTAKRKSRRRRYTQWQV